MTVRPNIAGVAVSPFQFPSLPDSAAQVEPTLHAVEAVANDPGGGAAETPGLDEQISAAAARDDAVDVAAAQAEAFQQGFEQGREEGYAAGFAQGAQAGEASVAEGARRLAAVVGRLGGALSTLEQPVEEAVAALGLEIARCVIGGEVKRSRAFLVALIREAIGKVPLEMGTPRILLNPDDVELMRRLVPEIGNGGAMVVADEGIEAGGCIVVADGAERPIKDRRWNPRNTGGVSQVNLTLASRWREVMLALFDGENE